MSSPVRASCSVFAGLTMSLVLSCLGFAQSDFSQDWRWAHFTVESGLPADRVDEVYETHDSTVWAATALGLAWYDGYQWISIDTGEGLLSNTAVDIVGEIDDSLVVGMGGTYFIGTRDGFRRLDFSSPTGTAAFEGRALLLIRNASLYEYRNGIVSPFQPSRDLTRGKTLKLFASRNGAVWVILLDGLYKWEGGRFQRKIASGSTPLGKTMVVENNRGSGICSVVFPFEKRGQWEWSPQSVPAQNRTERIDNIITMDISDDDEAIAVYPADQVRVRHRGEWSSILLNRAQIRDIGTVSFRHNGDLWVGTQHGLFLYRRSSSRWTYWDHPSPDLRNSVNEILRTRNGDTWVATSDGIEIHRSSGRVDGIESINGVELYVVTGLAEDLDGNVWVSSGASFFGAYRWNGVRWDHFTVSDDSGGIRFHKIRVDHEGRVWFLGIGKMFPPFEEVQPGAYVWEKGVFHRWGVREGLPNGRIYSFGEDSEGTLWFGTFAGLSRWKKGVWTHWSTRRGFRIGRVFTLAIDRYGRPWFGDYSDRNGIATVDEHDSVRYFTVADGLVDDKVWDIRFDDEGTMWAATAGGLSSYANGTWSTYSEKSGLQHISLWPVLPLTKTVYVGTTGKGVALLDRSESTSPPPRILLDKPLMDGEDVILRWKAYSYWGEQRPDEILTRVRIGSGSWQAWRRNNEIRLVDYQPGEYTFEVQAKSVFGSFDQNGARGSFLVPLPFLLRPFFLVPVSILLVTSLLLVTILFARKRRHDIALRKSEAKFRAVAEMTLSAILIYQDHRVVFANPGATRLTGYSEAELSSMNPWEILQDEDRAAVRGWEARQSPDTAKPQQSEFKIITKEGEERWANFSWGWIRYQEHPAILVSAFDVTDRKLAEDNLRSLAFELSSTEERERRRLATYLHDTIGQTLAFSKMKLRLLQQSVGEVGRSSPLQEIRELIDQSISDTRSLTYQLSPPVLYELNFVAALEWLINQIAQQHNIRIELEDDKVPKHLNEDLRVFLFHAIREILINVVKHAEATSVNVYFLKDRSTARIIIHDNGVGFNISGEHHTTGVPEGFGLFNIRERLRHLGGKLEVESRPGKGTTVTIETPLVEQEKTESRVPGGTA